MSGSDLSIELGYCFGMLEQSQLAGADDSFGAVLDLQLVENPQVVPLDRADGQEQPLADFSIGKSLCNEAQHFQFTFAQRLKNFRLLICDTCTCVRCMELPRFSGSSALFVLLVL